MAGLRRGDHILVRPGDRVPLDGVVREGSSNLDQAAITGESVPVAKTVGDGVYAGTVNVDGALQVEVTRLGGETTLARLVDLVAEAEASKSPAQRMTAQVERIFVPLVLVGAPLLVAGLFFTGTPLQDSFLRGLSLLVAASPCALAISTPAAVLSAVARAASGGVLIKGGAHLDALGSAAAIAFDKTGTLTVGKPKLMSIRTLEGSESGLLVLAASAEALSAHPLARAVTEAATERELGLLPASDLVAIHGKGIRAKVAGKEVAIGSEAMFDELPVVVRQVVEEAQSLGQTTMIVQSGGRFLGVLGVADSLRPEAKEALAGLARLGVERTILLSGDHERVATAVGTQLGIAEVRAPLMPEEKVRAMRIFARGGGVAMVGDGVNDAPALAAASVGVSLGGAG
ncbi:MAG TPA: heavy metal translocating P-type ATPase, partial [Myxococcota bacterium]|nr:heavy metal translocating P-type ATPase [Myxococcota bacterium]